MHTVLGLMTRTNVHRLAMGAPYKKACTSADLLELPICRGLVHTHCVCKKWSVTTDKQRHLVLLDHPCRS